MKWFKKRFCIIGATMMFLIPIIVAYTAVQSKQNKIDAIDFTEKSGYKIVVINDSIVGYVSQQDIYTIEETSNSETTFRLYSPQNIKSYQIYNFSIIQDISIGNSQKAKQIYVNNYLI